MSVLSPDDVYLAHHDALFGLAYRMLVDDGIFAVGNPDKLQRVAA